MQATATEPSSLVSARIYALILTSPWLKQMLLPEGLITSPYEILAYQATLTLEDAKGMNATFQRTQEVRFLQDGVSGILEHVWGDGVCVASYHNEAGSLEDSFKDEGKRHLVIGLKRAMGRGETLKFEVVRRAMAQFTKDEGWLETIIDHPVNGLGYRVIFPADRPCRRAVLHGEGVEAPLSVVKLAGGKTLVQFKVSRPRMDTAYTVRWSW